MIHESTVVVFKFSRISGMHSYAASSRRKTRESWWGHLALLERSCRSRSGVVADKGDLQVLIVLRKERDSSTADGVYLTHVECRARSGRSFTVTVLHGFIVCPSRFHRRGFIGRA